MPKTPPDSKSLSERLISDSAALRAIMGARLFSPTVGERYVHWDKLRFFPLPADGLSHELWWGAIKLARTSLIRSIPLTDANGTTFTIAMPDPLQRQLSELDRDLSGRVAVPEQVRNPGTRDTYIVSALIEEAITSSQLEGASTTRKVAEEMLRSGRKPRDRAEQMIFNNFDAMRLVRRLAAKPLSPEIVFEIHRSVTRDTLKRPEDAGRLRQTDDVVVEDSRDQTELHEPPPAAQLESRMAAMCAFANEETPDFYVHSIVRAALLHFWLGYDHPFVDGNGRTARALFYWSMLRSGYWLSEFLSISHILRKAPAKYARAFLYSESDDNDATYFVLYQLGVLQRSVKALHAYIRRNMREMDRMQLLLRKSQAFNHRQAAILGGALGDRYSQFTVATHANSHMVTPQTARNDLSKLTDLGLLVAVKAGRRIVYYPVDDLEERLSDVGRSPRGTSADSG